MPATIVKGQIAPQDYDQNQIERMVKAAVIESWLNENQLYRLYMMLPKRNQANYAMHHFESNPLLDQYDTAAANATAVATSITVTDPTIWIRGAIMHLKNALGTEQIYVKEEPVGAVCTVIRNIDGAGAIAITAGDLLINQGPAIGDGAGQPEAQQTKPVEVENYTQNYREVIMKMTGRSFSTKMKTGPEAARLRKEGIINFRSKVERTSLFGTKAKFNDSDGYQVTTSRGLLAGITTNKKSIVSFGDGNTTMTLKEFMEFLEQAFDKGSDHKVAICSGWFMAQIASLQFGQMIYKGGDTVFGFGDGSAKFPLVAETPLGTLGLIKHSQLFNYGGASRFSNYGAHCIVLDPNKMEFVEFTDRGFRIETYNGPKENTDHRDQYVEEIFQDIGIDLWNEDCHAVLYGAVATA